MAQEKEKVEKKIVAKLDMKIDKLIDMTDLLLVEFGYKMCERGHNIQYTLDAASKILKGKG